ncbi:MAG: hypothetical protein RLN77_00280 [Rhodospirillales bacterium]
MSVERLIMVIDGQGARGQNLKELLEFMDSPRVQIASPDDWRKRLGDRRLAAIFMGDDLPQEQIDRLMSDIAEVDPNAPIVMVTAGKGGAFGNA